VFRVAIPAALLVNIFCVSSAGFCQSSPQSQPSPAVPDNSSVAVATFQATTRMVTIEVVAKDSQGHHVTGLQARDFQVFEQAGSRGRERHEQNIVAFQEVRAAQLASPAGKQNEIPPGVFTNVITWQKIPAPPTILLVDGLNTDVKYQSQVHVQMLRMLRAMPNNVPVGVFLFGRRLQMLQDFTTDPRLLQAALDKAVSTAGTGVARLDPRDDPNATSVLLEELNGPERVAAPSVPRQGGENEEVKVIPQAIVDAVKRFEQETYASNMDMRVQQTIDALVSLGRHVAGYPGRKNLLWISTSFPIYLSPLLDDTGKPITEFSGLNNTGIRNYWQPLQVLSSVLSDAKVAVYPINPAGVEVPAIYEAGTRPPDYGGKKSGESLSRETVMRANEQDTMRVIADGTGGEVCTGNNNLGDCIRKAVDDSGAYYEIAYYPDSRNWNGEYRKIILKTRSPRVRLAYRQGYFAKSEGANGSNQKTELQQAACRDDLNASSIPISVKSLPPDSPEKLKYYLTINTSALTFSPASNGGHDLNMVVAICTFDQIGWPFQFMSDPIHRTFNATEYQSLATSGTLPHMVAVPGPKPASLRLLVKDIPSGKLGSVNIQVDNSTPAIPAQAPPGRDKPTEVH